MRDWMAYRRAALGGAAFVLAGLWLAGCTPAVGSRPDWRRELLAPNAEFSQMPFWFWNDALDDDEIRRQLADFRAHGVYGFVIHGRMGLPAEIPYMGERWLHHVRVAVEEAARTGMRVCLYDEGMYPSGSAHGRVVRSNPAFAAKGLAVVSQDITGPAPVAVPLKTDGDVVATVIARRLNDKNALDPQGVRVVEPGATSAALPAGAWRVMTFACVSSEGRIRGVHEGEEDNQPGAPPAADLLNPDAMKAFLRFAYDVYYDALRDHFGKTVIAVFTDEPSMLGRRGRRGLKPWTGGFAADFERRRGYSILPLLPALFYDLGGQTGKVREDFARTLADRLDETYYRPLSAWCGAHGVALTGHPAGGAEIRPLRHFQIPGQDIVWRAVLPNTPSAVEGPHSVLGKCSSSVARHDGRRRNANEVYGAFGWQLTMEEMKWLADWLMVRGVNLLYPHAFYYSIRDDRVLERPPDVGPHNAWWPHYRLFADYTTRLCGLLTDSRPVCDVAILASNNDLPWRAAKWLLRNQVDYSYLEDWRLCEQARIEGAALVVGEARYTTLIVDRDAPPGEPVAARIRAFEAAGGRVRHCRGEVTGVLVPADQRDVVADPPAADLRCAHVVKHGVDFYLFVNEGEGPIDTAVAVRCTGRAEWFDAWAGRFCPAAVERADAGRMRMPLRLGRRESIVLCVDRRQPVAPGATAAAIAATAPVSRRVAVAGPWTVTDPAGKVVGRALGDWVSSRSLESFAGTLTYRATFDMAERGDRRFELDLGRVGDFAVVRLNGVTLGPRFWAPYTWDATGAVRAGTNELEVEVTNSLANRYDPAHRRPSGLLGPVEVRSAAAAR